jgi:hypothetical protein
MASSFAAARRAGRAVLCLLIVAGAARAGAGPLAAPERELKAACICRVATFGDWPDAASPARGSVVALVADGDRLLALATW